VRRRARAHAPPDQSSRLQHRRADDAAPTPAMAARNGRHPGLTPFEPSCLGGSLWLPVLAGRPGAVEFRRRRGHNAPPLLFRGFSSNALGHRQDHGGLFVHGGSHAGEATLDLPGSAAARHSRPRPHARLHRVGPHGTQPDPMRQPMTAQPRVGRRVPSRNRDPGIPCGWICIREGLNLF
jgi:hypothetical protein